MVLLSMVVVRNENSGMQQAFCIIQAPLGGDEAHVVARGAYTPHWHFLLTVL